jgi:hypothetical protein
VTFVRDALDVAVRCLFFATAPFLLVLDFESHRDRPPIWIAIDELGAIVADETQLPRNAFKAMRRSAR